MRMDYLKFMRKVKEKFVPLLEKHSVEKMWKDHFSQLNKRNQDFYSRLSFRETFPKMIDEFNYYIIHNAPAKLRSRVLR